MPGSLFLSNMASHVTVAAELARADVMGLSGSIRQALDPRNPQVRTWAWAVLGGPSVASDAIRLVLLL